MEASKRDYNFARNQPWVKVCRSLSFVDETQDIAGLSDSGVTGLATAGDGDNAAASGGVCSRSQLSSPYSYTAVDASPPSPSASSWASQIASSSPDVHPPEARNLGRLPRDGDREAPRFNSTVQGAPSSPGDDASEVLPERSRPLPINPENVVSHTPNTLPASLDHPLTDQGAPLGFPCDDGFPELRYDESATPQGPGSTIYLEQPQWPLQNHQQAFLFRYYIEHIAPLLDLCDLDRRHFATVVPQRAAICPLLLYAVLAASAKRLSRVSDYDGIVVDRYHQSCLRQLIPALSSSAAIVDENLLTAIVILRFMEELDVPVAPPGPESHLVGTRVFLGAREEEGRGPRDLGPLSLAAFWLALRQEIYMAFVHARPVHANFALAEMGELIRPDDNGSGFANRVVVHCAHCLRYCYGEGERSIAAWRELREYQTWWWKEKPWYFEPVWAGGRSEADGFLPNEMYLNDAVVTGLQHYYLAHILLTAHNPEIPKLGPRQVAAFRRTNDEIKRTVRVICGIAEVGRAPPPLFLFYCFDDMKGCANFTLIVLQSNPRTAPAYVLVVPVFLLLLSLRALSSISNKLGLIS